MRATVSQVLWTEVQTKTHPQEAYKPTRRHLIGSELTLIPIDKCTKWLFTTSVQGPVTRENTGKVPKARKNLFQLSHRRIMLIFSSVSFEALQCTGNPGDSGMWLSRNGPTCQLSASFIPIAGASPLCSLPRIVTVLPGWGSCCQFFRMITWCRRQLVHNFKIM